MPLHYFRVGDRVRARSAGVVPEGTIGVIQHASRSADDFYEVWFDGDSCGRVVHARNLERVVLAREAAKERGRCGMP